MISQPRCIILVRSGSSYRRSGTARNAPPRAYIGRTPMSSIRMATYSSVVSTRPLSRASACTRTALKKSIADSTKGCPIWSGTVLRPRSQNLRSSDERHAHIRISTGSRTHCLISSPRITSPSGRGLLGFRRASVQTSTILRTPSLSSTSVYSSTRKKTFRKSTQVRSWSGCAGRQPKTRT